MALQTINLGNYANDGTGDDLRTAFEKVNANFADLSSTITISTAANVGDGIGLFYRKNLAELEFKSLTSSDNSVSITPELTSVDLKSVTILENDTTPMLGGDLGLNGHTIKEINGGAIEAKIYGISVPLLEQLMATLIASNNLTVDMGSFSNAIGSNNGVGGYQLEMGTFTDPYNNNHLDFGTL